MPQFAVASRTPGMTGIAGNSPAARGEIFGAMMIVVFPVLQAEGFNSLSLRLLGGSRGWRLGRGRSSRTRSGRGRRCGRLLGYRRAIHLEALDLGLAAQIL